MSAPHPTSGGTEEDQMGGPGESPISVTVTTPLEPSQRASLSEYYETIMEEVGSRAKSSRNKKTTLESEVGRLKEEIIAEEAKSQAIREENKSFDNKLQVRYDSELAFQNARLQRAQAELDRLAGSIEYLQEQKEGE